ncbi:MAG: hypothetical protein AAGB46_07060 [Verrucomicrobiota bacterium]
MRLSSLGYKRWEGQSTGIWTRRWVITKTGIDLCLKSKLLKIVIALSWCVSLIAIPVYFTLGQMLSPESGLMGYLSGVFGERFYQAITGLMSWLLLYPEICVNGIYRATFYQMMIGHMAFSFLAVSLFVPKLISHDMSSQAIVIYNSKALTRFDYMIGKFGIVFLILSFMWVAPTIFAWFVGNLLSPDWSFFVHSFDAVATSVLVGLVGVVALSCIALAVSALAKRTSTAVTMWIFISVMSVPISVIMKFVAGGWGAYLNFYYAIYSLGHSLLNLGQVLLDAQNMLPFFSFWMPPFSERDLDTLPMFQRDVVGPSVMLAIFVSISLLIISKKVKPQ